MEKRIGRNWLGRLCVGLLCLSGVGMGVLRAEGVPPVIKYQAVLRNVEGEPMVNRADLAVRITLRQGSPAGTVLYQETHTDLATDAFGLLLLEIGRGDVSNAGRASLSEVPWANSPIYAQVEIQADDNGYTTMGASELLSVPYALYAGGAGVGFDLADGFLPKYDAERSGLVNSGISQFNDKISFSFAGDEDYTFPTTRGRKGEVLMLIDDKGTLDWRPGGGGGGGADCANCDDLKFVYWDATANGNMGALTSADLYYDDATGDIYVDGVEFNSRTSAHLEGEVKIDATVSGDNNLQYNGLPRGNVWVGGPDGKSHPYVLGEGVSIDSATDKTKPVLNFGGGHAAWDSREEATSYYVYTKDKPGKNVLVGVGTGSAPQARFHMQGGSFLLSSDGSGFTDNVNFSAGNHFYWHSGKGALRMGYLDNGSGAWADAALEDGSIALGTGAQANAPDNVAIGREAKAVANNTMALGRKVQAQGDMDLALGTNVMVDGQKNIGIGGGSSSDLSNPTFFVKGSESVVLGYDMKTDSRGVIGIGLNNEIGTKEPYDIVLGNSNVNRAQGSSGDGGHNITIGTSNKTIASVDVSVQHNVQIGTDLSVTDGQQDISLGYQNTVSGSHCINIGNSNDIVLQNKTNTGICIGKDNKITSGSMGFSAAGPVLLGYRLEMHDPQEYRCVIVGRYNALANNFADKKEAAFVVGQGTDKARKNAMELSVDGELRVPGIVYCSGTGTYSDRTLKTDIRPLEADFSVLQALHPVRYRFKADEKQALQFGFIAQDVEVYFPHLVQTDGKGLKSLNYIGLLPVLWQYTQRLEQTVETQAAEIERLKTELESLKTDVQAIKAAMGIGE